MDSKKLRNLLEAVQAGQTPIDDALGQLKRLPFEDVGTYARLDLHRAVRQGHPEVVFCQNKTAAQVVGILTHLWDHHDRVLATRVIPDMAHEVQVHLPQAVYNTTSRLLWLNKDDEIPPPDVDMPHILVATGGTSDLPVAEEAAQTAEFFGCRVERAYDVGVAGLHRLLKEIDRLHAADVIISVAGMEGALTSVIGGLVSCPVIGVPTSVGYGAHFEGVAPLLSMLNACASGVTVVNIDNGFGAGLYANLIINQMLKYHRKETQLKQETSA